jgi:putative transposase
MLPVRKTLPHGTPPWIRDGAIFFITICTQPRGVNQLCQPETGAWIHESFQFREQRGDWWVHLLLLMPDHLHAVLSFAQEPGMTHAISPWKRFAARERGLQWQRDFFEHRLRDDDNRVEKAHYIRMNPVRAGLVTKPEEWPYAWSKGW